jgi:hypothetical protein
MVMMTIRAFMEAFVAVCGELGMEEDRLVPGGLTSLHERFDPDAEMSPERIAHGCAEYARYMSGATGRAFVSLLSFPVKKGLDGRDVAWAIIDQFNAWRQVREARGLRDVVLLHSACASFVTGLLGDNEVAGEGEEENRGMTPEEVVSVLEPVLGLILRDPDMRRMYGVALDAHSGDEDFGAILDLAIVAVACEDTEESLTPERLNKAVEQAEVEFAVQEAQRRSDGALPD